MAWLQGTTQPTTWQATATDSTSGLQVAGAVELLVYLSGSATNLPETAAFSAYSVTSTSTGNVLPVAAFTSSATNLVASFDGSTSTDSDGTITGYAWMFGDSATGSGVKTTHTYASAGTYTVSLKVTDNAGGTNTVSHPITVSATSVLPTYSSIANATKLAAGYYRTTLAHTTVTPTNGWSWSTYTQGLQTLFGQVGDQLYLNDNLSWGTSNTWAVDAVETNPDTVKALQTYYDLNALDSTASLTKADAAMASDLAEPAGLAVRLGGRAVHGSAGLDPLGNSNWQLGIPRQDGCALLWTRDQGATSSRCAGARRRSLVFSIRLAACGTATARSSAPRTPTASRSSGRAATAG